jgi:hypothetical protein
MHEHAVDERPFFIERGSPVRVRKRACTNAPETGRFSFRGGDARGGVVRKTARCGEWSFAAVIAADFAARYRRHAVRPHGKKRDRMTWTFLLETADG